MGKAVAIMWLEFTAITLVLCSLLLVPGYFTARAFGVPRTWSVCLAPILSLSLLCVVGQIYAFAHIIATPLLMVAPIVIVPVIAYVFARKHARPIPLTPMAWLLPAAFVALGSALGIYLFLFQLPQPDSLFQAYDVTQHLSLIQSFSDAGRFSSLGVSAYLSPADQLINPAPNAGFYPAAWHVLCALAVSLTGASVPVVINASMFVFSCVVYPLSILAFLCAIFPNQKHVVRFGCVVAVAFVAFPWALLVFGPVYPNLAGFATTPVIMALFISVLNTKNTAAQRICLSILLLISLIGQALLHPNTLFTCAVILVPYCTYHLWLFCKSKGLNNGRSLLASFAFVVGCAAIWYLCFKLPFLQDTVNHVWPPFTGRWQEIVNILTQTYTMGFFYEIAAQIVLGVLVVIGIIRALHEPSLRWLTVSYLLVCLICLESTTQSGALKQLVAGFWYTDPMRLAAMAVITATPFAALGLSWVYETTLSLTEAYNNKQRKQTHAPKIATAVICVFLALNFMPAFNLPGIHMQLTPEQQEQSKNPDWVPPTNMHTTFGDYRDIFKMTYTYGFPLSEQERLFLNEVKDIVPEDSVIINDPMDGSFLAYGVTDLRVYYRNFVGIDCDAETEQSKAIRSHLSEYTSNPNVQEAVRTLEAQYAIVLSNVGSDSSFINLRGDYNPSQFSGISSITPDTPGFTCIHQREDMRLYKIDG